MRELEEKAAWITARPIFADAGAILPAAVSLPYSLPATARLFRWLVLGIAAGYLVFGRTFAYFGAPGLYPGELLLLAALCTRYSWIRTYLAYLRSSPFLVVSVSAFLIWGCVEGLRGYIAGYPTIDVLKGLPAHYYPFLLFAGLSAGKLVTTANLRRYFAWLTVATGISAVIGTVAANFDINGGVLPWAPDVTLLSGASMPPFCLLAYAALSKRMGARFLVVTFPVVVALLIGGRGSLLGAIGGFAVLAILPHRFRYVVRMALPALAGIACWFAFSELLPDFGGRSGHATPSLVAARLVSVVDLRLAQDLVDGSDTDLSELSVDAGDAQWRRDLWNDTLASLTSVSDWMTGHGYGPVLGDLLPGSSGEGYGHDLRTPHNFAIYLLGYTGLIGCALYLAVLSSIVFAILKCPPSLAKDAVIVSGVSAIIMALTGSVFETPFGAVPAYVCIGALLGVAQDQPAVVRS